MIELKSIFPENSLEEWIVQLKKELKGDNFEKLWRKDEVEELSYPTFHHAQSSNIIPQAPNKFPNVRGTKMKNNAWLNGFEIDVQSEKEANQKAIEILMKGCDLLIFNLFDGKVKNWNVLFQEIKLEFIEVQFGIQNLEQFKSLLAHFGNSLPPTIKINIDFIALSDLQISSWLTEIKELKTPFCLANGFAIQQCGANTWQEIAYCVSSAHEYLVKLMELGISAVQANSFILFSIGIGSNYFHEIAKIRALRQVWSLILNQYQDDTDFVQCCSITAHIGHMNKSIIDPHTNLLRQTSEAMSAIAGGIDALVVHPYDSKSINGSSTLAERMALNISLILKEESYFDSVIDPLGGSYAVEELTHLIGEKAWELFQKMEESGGISTKVSKDFLKSDVIQKAELRIQNILSNNSTLIGINKFKNLKPETNKFLPAPGYLEMKQIFFENAISHIHETN